MIALKVQDISIPALGFGTWKLRDQDCVEAVHLALETGYRHIDTAQIYENEAEVGTALHQSAIPRADVFLTTKVWMTNVGKANFQKSVDESLGKLKTDYVDLLLIHWPVNEVPFAEQMAALEAVQKAGQTRLIGVSNFTVAQMQDVRENLGANIANNQVEYHPYLSQEPVLEYVRSNEMFMTAYSPLARGKINGSPLLTEIAAKYHKSVGQITLRWLIQQKNVAAIPKAATPKHIQDNFNISDFVLSDDDMAKIHSLANPDGRMVNPDWAPDWDKNTAD